MGESEYQKTILIPLPYINAYNLCLQSAALFDGAHIDSIDRNNGIIVVTEPNFVFSHTGYPQYQITYSICRISSSETSVEIHSKTIYYYFTFGRDPNKRNIDIIIAFLKEQSQRQVHSVQEKTRISNPVIISFFSFLLPGLGQIWNDQKEKAVLIFGITMVSLFFIVELGFLWWVIGIFDAFSVAYRKYKAGIQMEPVNKRILFAYIVVSVSILITTIIIRLVILGKWVPIFR